MASLRQTIITQDGKPHEQKSHRTVFSETQQVQLEPKKWQEDLFFGELLKCYDYQLFLKAVSVLCFHGVLNLVSKNCESVQRDSQGGTLRAGSCGKFTKKMTKTLEITSRGFLWARKRAKQKVRVTITMEQ